MKAYAHKLTSNFLSFAIIFLAYYACTPLKKEEHFPDPKVKINSNNLGTKTDTGFAWPGQKVELNYTATVPGGIRSIAVLLSVDGGAEYPLEGYPKTADFSTSTSQTESLNIFAAAGGLMKVRIVAVNVKGQTQQTQFYIRVKTLVTVRFTANSLGNDSTSGLASPSGEVNLTYTAITNGNLAKINATQTTENTERDLTGYPKSSGFNSTKSHSETIRVIAPVNGFSVVKIEAIDVDGQSNYATYTILTSQNFGLKTWFNLYLYTADAGIAAISGDKVAAFLNTTTVIKNTRSEIASLSTSQQAQYDLTLGKIGSKTFFISPNSRVNYSLLNASNPTSTYFGPFFGNYSGLTHTDLVNLINPSKDTIGYNYSDFLYFKIQLVKRELYKLPLKMELLFRPIGLG